MNTITTQRRRGTEPGRLTHEASSRIAAMVATFRRIASAAAEGTAMAAEACELASRLEAFLRAHRGQS